MVYKLGVTALDMKYVQDKITELREKHGLSGYELSYQLGHSKNYIHNIVSGYSQTTVEELLYIIEFFGIEPKDFFDEKHDYADPAYAKQVIDSMKGMSSDDLAALAHIAKRIGNKED